MAERPAFHALHYTGPGTDLTIGLADGHEWQGGASTAKNGITCNPTSRPRKCSPRRMRGGSSGHVVSTKPLSYQGTLIDNIAVRFEAGRIVEAKASRGEEVLNKVLDTDEGARRLGEVALVPHSSPISKSGLLFFNTLFDENAACHIALGQCYSKCFVDGAKLTPEQIAAQGGNKSLIHIDWMIGSDKIDIDGVHADGRARAGVPQGRVGLIVVNGRREPPPDAKVSVFGALMPPVAPIALRCGRSCMQPWPWRFGRFGLKHPNSIKSTAHAAVHLPAARELRPIRVRGAIRRSSAKRQPRFSIS